MSEAPSKTSNTRKIKIRQAVKDKGVFETGVDVVEHELELDEDDDGRVRAARLYNDGKLTHKQMKEILMRQLKQERIFGFGSFDEFFTDYFKKELVAVEDLNRVRQLKEARKKYERRWQGPRAPAYELDTERAQHLRMQQQMQEAEAQQLLGPQEPVQPESHLNSDLFDSRQQPILMQAQDDMNVGQEAN